MPTAISGDESRLRLATEPSADPVCSEDYGVYSADADSTARIESLPCENDVTTSDSVKLAHSINTPIYMQRQQTLGSLSNATTNTFKLFDAFLHSVKFITMPPGKKAPPQQSSLSKFWGGKQKK